MYATLFLCILDALPPFFAMDIYLILKIFKGLFFLLFTVEKLHTAIVFLHFQFDRFLGTIQILRNQKGGWVGLAKCLHLLTRWVGGVGKMLT